MKNIWSLIFIITTILIGLIVTGRIAENKTLTIVILIVQAISWVGYINLLDMKKSYKRGLSITFICLACLVCLFYMLTK